MSSIRNSVTYTTEQRDGDKTIRVEQASRLDRDRKLTYRGAERILRRERGDKTILVTRIETAIYT
jgi:hypothetical protein